VAFSALQSLKPRALQHDADAAERREDHAVGGEMMLTIQVLVCHADGTQTLELREVGEDWFPAAPQM
jgi:hypothetical protein